MVEIASDCGGRREGSDGQARVRWAVTFRPKIADVSILLKTGRVLSRRALGGRTCVWCLVCRNDLEGFRRFVCGCSRGVPREVASTFSQLDDKTNRGHFDDESCSAAWVPNRVNSTPGEFWNLNSGKVSSFYFHTHGTPWVRCGLKMTSDGPRVPPSFPHQQRMANPSPVVFEPVREMTPLPHITERPFVTASQSASPPIAVSLGFSDTEECWVPTPCECIGSTGRCVCSCLVGFTWDTEPTCFQVYSQYVLLLINCLVCCPRKVGPFHRCGGGLYKSF